ncbi:MULTISPECIES: SDR family NAD(P)-dependent oxidoreductase [Streptomyces]|uniref:SDR family NAD(P)-dependent oxidoreductase n=1 Tax=Streptomyces TaxID=1883 RepID=UPI001CCECB9F|nr:MULTISPECIES: SDR family NAD(P)-dependent oxidoreductase [Streptomyces]UBI40888.1 SDR family oxidoreductase [Streptomyces mobaraensis]
MSSRSPSASPAPLSPSPISNSSPHPHPGPGSRSGLAGKAALVTGGSGGIGAATCRALAAHGARVAVTGRNAAAVAAVVTSIAEGGGQALAAPADVTDPAAVDRLRARVEGEFGPVEILAPFAGGQGGPVPTAELDPDRWRSVIESDLTSVFLTVSAFLPGMIEKGSGAVVLMSSTAGRVPGGANIAYAVAKAGVVMFAKHLAAEVGRHGVRVNCLAPSAVPNDRMRRETTDGQRAALAAGFPLGRLGRSDDIAEAVLYLASDAASWVTGATLDLTGGRVIA